VYPAHPGFSDKASTLFTMEQGAPEELPDALRGEKWSFVQLPLATLQQVCVSSGRREAGQGGRCRALRVCPLACLPHGLRSPRTTHPLPMPPPSQELQDVAAGKSFGATLDLAAVRQTLTPDTLVPGVAVYRWGWCGCGCGGCMCVRVVC
jgi:hypothetical protein